MKFDFGYNPTLLRASTFARLSLSSNYRLLHLPVEMGEMNRLFAFLFLLDFCTSIATSGPIIWGDGKVLPFSDQFQLSGMGKALPVSDVKLSDYMTRMLLNIFQLVDRIAESQLPSRTAAQEYLNFIKPKALKKRTGTLEMPKTDKRFPDCVGTSWKPLPRHPTQVVSPKMKKKGRALPTVASKLLSQEDDGEAEEEVVAAQRKGKTRQIQDGLERIAGLPHSDNNGVDEHNVGETELLEDSNMLGGILDDWEVQAAPTTAFANFPPVAGPECLREQRDSSQHPNVVTQGLEQREGYPKPALPPPLPTERLAVPFVPFIYLQRSISAHAPLFAKDYKNSATSEAKEETRWMILCKAQMYAHKASPIPGVEEALKAIDASLEHAPDAVDASLEQAPAAVVELEGKDVTEGLRSKVYHSRVSDFLEEFQKKLNRVERAEFVTSVINTLQDEGFRFLKKTGEEMDMHATFLKVRKYFYWLIKAAKLKAEAPAAEDEAPAAPGPRDILLCPLSSLSVTHPANVAYRQLVSDLTSEFQNASKERKKEVSHQVVQVLQTQGYRFVEKSDEGLWAEATQTRINHKVLQYLRDKGWKYNVSIKKARDTQSKIGTATNETTVQITKKRKALDMTGSRTGTATTATMTGTGANDANETTVLQMPTNAKLTEPTIPAPAAATGNPTEDFLDEVNDETVPDDVETERPVVNGMILMLQEYMCDPCLVPDEAAHLKNLASELQKLPQARSVTARLSLDYRGAQIVEKVVRKQSERKELDSTEKKNDEDDSDDDIEE